MPASYIICINCTVKRPECFIITHVNISWGVYGVCRQKDVEIRCMGTDIGLFSYKKTCIAKVLSPAAN